MLINLQLHKYDRHIYPHLKNGIIIDTSVFKIIIDGIVSTRISKKESQEFSRVLLFLDYLKINNKWNKFLITPHILTETCTHLRNDYSKWENFPEIINEVIPIINEIQEKTVKKNDILRLIDPKNPVMEIGDISIFVIADNFASKGVKVAILSNDRKLNRKYEYSKDVMVLDYRSNILNFL